MRHLNKNEELSKGLEIIIFRHKYIEFPGMKPLTFFVMMIVLLTRNSKCLFFKIPPNFMNLTEKKSSFMVSEHSQLCQDFHTLLACVTNIQ